MKTNNLSKAVNEVIKGNDTILMATEFGNADGIVSAVEDKLRDAKETSSAIASAFVGIVPHTHFYSPRVSKPKDGEKAKKPKGTATIAFYDEHRKANAVGRIKDKQERADFLLSDDEAEATLPQKRYKRRRVLIQQSVTWIKRLASAVRKAEINAMPKDEAIAERNKDRIVEGREKARSLGNWIKKHFSEDTSTLCAKHINGLINDIK
tara:strand:+ start:143 stop:766 length:624 start_codon:yes stop_codon:yes gene_type:complete